MTSNTLSRRTVVYLRDHSACDRRAAGSRTACLSSSAILPNMPSYARLFRGMVRAFTLPEVNCLLELAPQFTLPDPTHIGGILGFILI